MENTKIIEINDMGTVKKFRIRLFDVLSGLAFFDTALQKIADRKSLSIQPFLEPLLKLAVPMDDLGQTELSTGRPFSLQDASVIFQNPLSVIELGFEILEFQKVFTESSPRFQKLTKILAKGSLI